MGAVGRRRACSELGHQGCLGQDWTGGEGACSEPASPPPPWLVWMPEQSCLGPGNKSEALGRRPGEAGHVPSPQPNGLRPPAASSVFPGGELGCLLAAQGLLGRQLASFLVELEAWGTGAVVLWREGAHPPSLQNQ